MDLVQDRQGVIPAIVRGGDNGGLCIKIGLPYDLASGN